MTPIRGILTLSAMFAIGVIVGMIVEMASNKDVSGERVAAVLGLGVAGIGAIKELLNQNGRD